MSGTSREATGRCSSFRTARTTSPREGECSWADFAAAIFAEAGLACRVVPIASEELDRPAPRPAYSVLRSEHPGTPRLPHWREGLRACLERLP